MLTAFNELLADSNTTEHHCQAFLESNTEMIPTPFLLNHGLHFDSIITKLPLDTSIVTDFAYLTKSTAFWHLVLVELESPNHQLFRGLSSRVVPSAKLTESIAQVHSWMDFARNNRAEILRRLGPILTPLGDNPVHFKYLLVVGRRGRQATDQSIRNRLSTLGSDEFYIWTYDSLISAYENSRPRRKNILVLSQDHFAMRELNADPMNILRFCNPEDIEFTEQQRRTIASNGYEIDKWYRHEPIDFVIDLGPNAKRVEW